MKGTISVTRGVISASRRLIFIQLIFICIFTPAAHAGFIGDYSLNNFTLVNTNADGFVSTPDNGLTAVLTGGNNGSGEPGTTDLLTTATGTGTVAFHYTYSALDFPGYDYAGYLVNSAFTQLADTDGQSGNASFMVTAGQIFGFRVGTLDNTGEPGILTISNFSAPSGGGAVPEPGTAPIVFMGLAAAVYYRCRRRAIAAKKSS
jgi:hypothetical protein